MKTPREIIIERHQRAEAKLSAIRAKDLAAYARASDEASRQSRPAFSLAAAVRGLWWEAVWPWRRAWIGVAAAWLVILALDMPGRDAPGTSAAAPPRPNPDVIAVLQQQEQLLTQLLGTEAPTPGSKPRNPGPRSAVEPPRAAVRGTGSREGSPFTYVA
jgi:hypothetical protein